MRGTGRLHTPKQRTTTEPNQPVGEDMLAPTEALRLLRDTVRRAARERVAPLAAAIDAAGEFNRRSRLCAGIWGS